MKITGNLILMTTICVIIFWVLMALRPAAAQSNAYARYGQDPREYGEPCWSAAVSKCTREQRGGVVRGLGKYTRKRR
jgi:hypothetical protein